MSKIISRWIEKWWWVITGIILGGLLVYGYREMFFHQDDLDWLAMANHPFWQVMAAPIGDHVDYLFRILFKIEWNLFGLYFPGYYTVSVAMHAIVIYLLYILARETSARRDLAAISALLFTINTNWTEVVLWISGQTISITILFVLLAMLSIWKKKGEVFTLFLASWTSALALGLPIATLLVYGIQKSKKYIYIFKSKTGWGTLLTLFGVAMVYYFFGTDGTKIEFGWQWGVQVAMVWVLAMVNSVVGRLFLPFDRFETLRIVGVLIIFLGGTWAWRDKLISIWRDSWSRFLILQISFYYLIVSVGRAQYGVGIMRAERYAYLGLALFLLLAVRVLRNWKIDKWVWIVPALIIVQSLGFYVRARAYVIRPQQMRNLFEEVRKTDRSAINPDEYLPHFVLNDERLKYSDLLKLIND